MSSLDFESQSHCCFFGIWDDGSWLKIDDVNYFNDAAELLQCGFNPVTVLFTHEGFNAMCGLSGGNHILYTWFNLSGQYIFGPYYYTGVFMNVALSFVAAECFCRALQQSGFDANYSRWAQAYFLVHWDIIAWTSFINLKDMLVLTLTVAGFLACLSYVRTRAARHLCVFAVIAFLFYWIRFYVPLLMLIAVAVWLLTQWRDSRKYLLIPLALGAMCWFLPTVVDNSGLISTENVVYGCFRFVFTPMPWNVDPGHSFLVIPSTLHWLFAVPVLIGGWLIWNRSVSARLPIVYLAILVLLYGVTHDLQGPRHRFQLTFVFVWAQFQFLWAMRPSRTAVGLSVPSFDRVQLRTAA